MVANLQSDPNEVTRENVSIWVQTLVDRGVQPDEAFRQVYERLEHAGQLEDLARIHGATLVGMIWRPWNSALRPANVGFEFRQITPDSSPSPAQPRQRSVTATAPPPVLPMPTLAARSLLDVMYKVGSEWVRLGDMNKVFCHAVFKQYRASALSDEHNARYFRALEEALGDGEVVGQKFDDEKLMRLYRIAKP